MTAAGDGKRLCRDQATGFGLSTRSGLHFGEIELRDDDIGGLGVVLATQPRYYSTVYYGGTVYYYSDGVYYHRTGSTYVVVPAPTGVVQRPAW